MALHHAKGVQLSNGNTSAAGLLSHGLRVAAGLGLILSCAALTPGDEHGSISEEPSAQAAGESDGPSPEPSTPPTFRRLALATAAAAVVGADTESATHCNGCSLDGSNYGTYREYGRPGSADATSTVSSVGGLLAAGGGTATHANASVNLPLGSPVHLQAMLDATPSAGTGHWRPAVLAGGPSSSLPTAVPESTAPLRTALDELFSQPESAPASVPPTSTAPTVSPVLMAALQPEPAAVGPTALFDPGMLAAASPVYRREAPMRGGELLKSVEAPKGRDAAGSADPAQAIDTAATPGNTEQGIDPTRLTDAAPTGSPAVDAARVAGSNKEPDTGKGVDTAKVDTAPRIDTLPASVSPSVPTTTTSGLLPKGPVLALPVAMAPGGDSLPPISSDGLPSLATLPTQAFDMAPGIAHPGPVGAQPSGFPVANTAVPNLIDRLVAIIPDGGVGCCAPTSGGAAPSVPGNSPVDVLFGSGDDPRTEKVSTTSPISSGDPGFLQPVADVALNAPAALLAAVVPEPSTLALLGAALWGLAASRRPARKKVGR